MVHAALELLRQWSEREPPSARPQMTLIASSWAWRSLSVYNPNIDRTSARSSRKLSICLSSSSVRHTRPRHSARNHLARVCASRICCCQ